MEWLESQPGFVPIDQLSEESGVKKDLIEDLKSVEIDGEYIALVNGYRKDGIDRTKIILEAMREVKDRITIDELSEKTGIETEVLRRYLYRIPEVVNVGNSTFALKENGYSDKDTKELIVEYLEAFEYQSNASYPIKDIIKYVQRRRAVGENAVWSVIYNNPDLFTRFSDGTLALARWGLKSDTQERKVYEVDTQEAIKEVLRNNSERALSNKEIAELVEEKFQGKASSVLVTISMETKKMADEGILERLGTTTYYYKIAE